MDFIRSCHKHRLRCLLRTLYADLSYYRARGSPDAGVVLRIASALRQLNKLERNHG